MAVPVRYAIVGSGMMGVEHIFNIQALGDEQRAVISAIVDPHPPSVEAALKAVGPQREKEVKVFSTIDELLKDDDACDVVVVSSPNMTHAEILLSILKNPKPHHVLVEKPLCTTIPHCKQVVAAANSRDHEMLVQVGLEYRYMPPVARLLKEVHENKAAGKVRMVAIREHRFPFLVKVKNWNRFNRNSGGTLVEKCCHFFDLMNLIIQRRPVRVLASGAQDVNHLDERYDGETPDILDNAYVIVDYAGGARACLDLCMFAEGSRNEQEICVVGDEGKVEALVPEGIVRVGKRSEGRAGVKTIECHDARVKYEGLHHGSSFVEHLEFLAQVRERQRRAQEAGQNGEHEAGDKESRLSSAAAGLEEGLLAVAIGVAAHKSIDEGRPVLLSEVLQ